MKSLTKWFKSGNEVLSGLLEEELNVGKFATTKWFMQKYMISQYLIKKKSKKKSKT